MDRKKETAIKIIKKLRREGFAAYFVGGCVRDMLMRKNPRDFDIATSALPSQIKRVFPNKTYPIGAKFGTLLLVKDKIPYQISTFRNKKGKYSSSLLEDIISRDFTINSAVYDPIKKKIVDLVGAKEDIKKRKICAIGDASLKFKQDPLRLIRAIRLSVTLGFKIEKKTLSAIKKMAASVKKVSSERIRDELTLIFTSQHPGKGLKLLNDTGLLKHILPDVDKLKGVEQPRAFHPEGDVFEHTLLMLAKLKNPSLVLAFSCLLHDIGKPKTFKRADRIRFNRHDQVGAQMSERMLKRLRFTNSQTKDIVGCVKNHMRMMEAPKMRTATLKRLFMRPTFNDELKLHYVDCLASHRDLTVYRFLGKEYNKFKKSPPTLKPLLSGDELIKMGFTPGPIFGKILKDLVDLQLEGKLENKTKARHWVLNNFKHKTGVKR